MTPYICSQFSTVNFSPPLHLAQWPMPIPCPHSMLLLYFQLTAFLLTARCWLGHIFLHTAMFDDTRLRQPFSGVVIGQSLVRLFTNLSIPWALTKSSFSHRCVLIGIPVCAYILTLLNQLMAKLNLIPYLLKYLEHNVEKWRAVE